MRARLSWAWWEIVSSGVSLAIATGIVTMFGSFAERVPAWFGSWLPSVVVHEAQQSFRDKEQGGFLLSNEKVRSGTPLPPIFHIEATYDAYSPPLGLSVHLCRPDRSRIEQPLPVHEVGAHWQTQYCFDMPGTVSPRDGLTVTGYLVHKRWFGEVHEPVPSFTFAPL